MFARLYEGPVRLRRNGRQPRAVGLFFSVKNGRHMPYESKLELHGLWRAEADSAVVRSWAQPFTLSLVRGGELIRYTPDRLDLLASGHQRVVEVKDHMTPEDAQVRYGPVAELLERRGMSFELHQRFTIEAQPSLAGVEALLRRRRTSLSSADEERIRQRLVNGLCSFGELSNCVSPGLLGWAKLCAAVVRRIVRVDLVDGLHSQSLVEPVA